MRSILILRSLLLAAFLLLGSFANAQINYCLPAAYGSCSSGEFIQSIWTTNCDTNLVNLNTGCNGNPGNYISYNFGFSAHKGYTIDMHLVNGPSSNPAWLNVYIDFNMNGLFDVFERVYFSTTSFGANDTINMGFVIPSTAATGITGMRVMRENTQFIQSCGVSGSGEIEDYIINIVAPCATPPTAVLSASSLCNSSLPITLSASITPLMQYTVHELWEYPASMSSGSQMVNDTSLTYTTSLQNTCYYMAVGCELSPGGLIFSTSLSNTICTGTGPCQDSVWPGDANYDLIANNLDFLAVGVKFGTTGAPRVGGSILYTPQFCYNWADSLNGVNTKNVDCNGDSTVGWADTLAIIMNYGQAHLKPGVGSQAKNTSNPDLYFDHTGAAFVNNHTVQIPINLGTLNVPASNVYGVAGTIRQTGVSQSAYMGMDWNGSWLYDPTNTLQHARSLSMNQMDFVLCRTNHMGLTNNGTIGVLQLPISSITSPVIILHMENVVMIDSTGTELPVNAISDTIVLTGITTFLANDGVTISPNPAHDAITLTTDVAGIFELYDLKGTRVKRVAIAKAGEELIDIRGIAPGNYTYRYLQQTGETTKGKLMIK